MRDDNLLGDPFTTPLRSLADIQCLERAAHLGAPVFEEVVRSLLARWAAGLREEEGLLHLVCALHLSRQKPGWRTGQLPDTPSTARLIDDLGGLDALGPETCFTLAWVGHRTPDVVTGLDDATASPELLAQRALRRVPGSGLFGHWRFFFGHREAAEDVHRARRALLNELQARFAGRGAVTTVIDPPLRRAIRTAIRAPRL